MLALEVLAAAEGVQVMELGLVACEILPGRRWIQCSTLVSNYAYDFRSILKRDRRLYYSLAPFRH